MIGKVALATWFGAMVLLSAGLLAKHIVALPAPQSERLGPALDALRSPVEHDRWLAVHVLYAECRCSNRIVEHLVNTKRPDDWAEMILWVGKAAPKAELAQRFDVRQINAAELASYGIEAAPSMIVIDPAGRVRYSGGYTDRKQGPAIEDRRIMHDARVGAVTSLPVFGCAVSDRLRTELSTLPAP